MNEDHRNTDLNRISEYLSDKIRNFIKANTNIVVLGKYSELCKDSQINNCTDIDIYSETLSSSVSIHSQYDIDVMSDLLIKRLENKLTSDNKLFCVIMGNELVICTAQQDAHGYICAKLNLHVVKKYTLNEEHKLD